jgi:hypothetical protein
VTLAISIQTILALAIPPAGKARVEALAILLPALTLLAGAALSFGLARPRILALDDLFRLGDRIRVALAVRAVVASTFEGAHSPRGEALAVHLQALSFFTCASPFFLLYYGTRANGFMVGVLEFELE